MRTALLLAAFVLVLPFASAGAGDEVTETWDRVHISGSPAGFTHTTQRTVDGVLETSVVSEISLKRMGQTIEIASSSRTSETPDGALLRIESTSKMSAQETTTIYTFADGQVTIATQNMGTTREVVQKVAGDLKGPSQMLAASRALAGTSGESVSITTFMADFQGVVTATLTSRGIESIEMHDGATVEATRIDGKLVLQGGTPVPMSPITWVDAAGDAIKTRVEVTGMVIETYRVGSEAEAKGQGEPAPGPRPDVFLDTLIQEADPIPVPRRLEEAWIVVRPRHAGATLPDLADAGHEVTPQDDGSVLIHARRGGPAPGAYGTRPLLDPPAELVDALAASSMIQSDAPEILAIVNETVGDEPAAWPAAQALERWVDDRISVKSMGVAFGSALEAFRAREGDCTEHAVLLAALCRAAGIPARVVMGLEYLHGIWGGHAWNEVWIEGAWYPLDATNGLGFVDPLHLPLAHMVMKEGAASESIQLLSAIGSLDVDIQEVMRDGRRIRVDDPTLVTTSAGTYSNRVLGISFRAPDGWRLDPPTRTPGPSARVMDVEGTMAGGRTVDIEIDMMDAPAGEDWDASLRMFRTTAERTTSGTVDGRPARSMTQVRSDRTQRRVLVMADGALWVFTLDHAQGTTDTALAALLDTVDFDVR